MNWKSWPERLDRAIFGNPNKIPKGLGHTVIQEFDVSNRTGDRRINWWHGTYHGLKPYYGREYRFDLQVRYSPHRYEFFIESRPDFDNPYSGFKKADKPVLGLRDYVVNNMPGQVVGALLGSYFFTVSLTRERDRTWQEQPPTEFYDKLTEFYMNMHEGIVGCFIRKVNGEEYPLSFPQNIAEPPQDPAPTT